MARQKWGYASLVTYSFNVSVNKLAIAEEVITSAGNILIAAGFEPSEIESLFRQAADQMASGEAVEIGSSNESTEASESIDAHDIRNEFQELPAIGSLSKLKMRAEAIGRPCDGREILYKCLPLAMEMLPHIMAAQSWLTAAARNAGVPVEEEKNAWVSRASDDELDCAHEVIFLDDFDFTYELNFDFIQDVVHELTDEGDVAALSSLKNQLALRGIIVPPDLRDAIADGTRTLALRDTFDQFILGQQEEVMETPLLEQFVRAFDFPQPSYFLTGWLQKLEEAGKIERYKRANRWRIQVLAN